MLRDGGQIAVKLRTWRDRNKPPLHLLHPSKTGGTAVKYALTGASASGFRLVLHPHRVMLADIPRGEQVCFVVREPASRFVSGFYSRLRKGGVAHPKEWTDAERTAFERFATPDDLARALYASDPATATAAREAVEAVKHLRIKQVDWVGDLDTLRRRADDILFVGRQWALDEDFARLVRLIGLPPGTTLPAGDAAHRAPAGASAPLSDAGRAAVLRWYAADLDLLAALEELGPRVGYTARVPDAGG